MNIKYEAVFILKENCETKSVTAEIDKVIEEQKGKIFFREELGLRKLAYKVKGNSNGYHYGLNVEADENLKNSLGR